jgi:hypothetical protein
MEFHTCAVQHPRGVDCHVYKATMPRTESTRWAASRYCNCKKLCEWVLLRVVSGPLTCCACCRSGLYSRHWYSALSKYTCMHDNRSANSPHVSIPADELAQRVAHDNATCGHAHNVPNVQQALVQSLVKVHLQTRQQHGALFFATAGTLVWYSY